MRGKMIALEGLEGAGKTEALKVCRDVLAKSNIECISTREPGGTPIAEELRNIAKSDWGEETFVPEAELMIMYSSRLQLLENVIKPALDRNIYVLGDRHDWSSIAYQGWGRGICDSTLDKLRSIALKGFQPDLIIYMDVDPKEGLRRAKGRGEMDRIEKESLDFFNRVREGYINLHKSSTNSIMIDANQDINAVRHELKQIIEQFLKS